MDRFRLEGHVAIGIEISMEMPAGFDAVINLNTADLDHAVAAQRVEPCRLRIENNFPHGPVIPRRRVADKREYP